MGAAEKASIEEDTDRDAAPTRIQDGLGDDLGVDLLDRDVEGLLGRIDEPRLLQCRGRDKLVAHGGFKTLAALPRGGTLGKRRVTPSHGAQ